MTVPPSPALLAEVLKKAAVMWVSCSGGPARALWCVPVGGRLGTVTGPREQDDPGFAADPVPVVSLRGDHGGTVAVFGARAHRVEPDAPRWAELTGPLAQKRLNLTGDDDTAARWAAECAVWELEPVQD